MEREKVIQTPEEAARRYMERIRVHPDTHFCFNTIFCDPEGERLTFRTIYYAALRWAKQHPEALKDWEG